jgi:hypothetical protein
LPEAGIDEVAAILERFGKECGEATGRLRRALSSHAMAGSSIPNVMIVVVVITRDCSEDLAPPTATVGRSAETRTRHEYAQANSSQPPDTHPPGTPDDDTE